MRTTQHTEPEQRKAPLAPIAEWLELSKEEREEQCPDSDTSYAVPVRRVRTLPAASSRQGVMLYSRETCSKEITA